MLKAVLKHMSANSLKLFGPHTTKWRPCKVFAKLNENHLLIVSLNFKSRYYRQVELYFISRRKVIS